MKKDLMEILACPVCHGELVLTVAKEEDGEIVSGSLYSARCPRTYPIIDSIPELLPPRAA